MNWRGRGTDFKLDVGMPVPVAGTTGCACNTNEYLDAKVIVFTDAMQHNAEAML